MVAKLVSQMVLTHHEQPKQVVARKLGKRLLAKMLADSLKWNGREDVPNPIPLSHAVERLHHPMPLVDSDPDPTTILQRVPPCVLLPQEQNHKQSRNDVIANYGFLSNVNRLAVWIYDNETDSVVSVPSDTHFGILPDAVTFNPFRETTLRKKQRAKPQWSFKTMMKRPWIAGDNPKQFGERLFVPFWDNHYAPHSETTYSFHKHGEGMVMTHRGKAYANSLDKRTIMIGGLRDWLRETKSERRNRYRACLSSAKFGDGMAVAENGCRIPKKIGRAHV